MRYMVLTCKHHDGFCMFDTRLTDYRITSPESPYGRDLVKQLAQACHRGGIEWGIYYSQVDWHHPDYRTQNHRRYVQYLHAQIRELLSNYGQVGMIFFDGLEGKASDWDAPDLFRMARRLQPHVMINNRCGLAGDYDTPEQRVGGMQTDRPWESCATLGTQWSWKPDDRITSLRQCVRMLVNVVVGDGNLLLNVGPMPEGRIEPRQVRRLNEIGKWLTQYGESIYDTRGGPFRCAGWGGAAYKGNVIYVHILDDELDTVLLPGIAKKIIAGRVLTGGTATVKQTDGAVRISVPKADRKKIDTIVALDLDGAAAEANPRYPVSGSLATGKKVTASNHFCKDYTNQNGPEKAFDDDLTPCWVTDWGVRKAWLEVDWGSREGSGRR